MPDQIKIKKTGNNQWQVDAKSGTGEIELVVEDASGNGQKPKEVKVKFGSSDTIIVDP